MNPRRFPPPWSVEERPACYIVKDATGFAVAYVYTKEEPGRRTAANLMTQDEDRSARQSADYLGRRSGEIRGGRRRGTAFIQIKAGLFSACKIAKRELANEQLAKGS